MARDLARAQARTSRARVARARISQARISGRCLLLFAALLVAGAPVLTAHAARVPLFADVQHAMSLDEAADRVRSAYGGQVIAASPTRTGGREGYRIRVILDDGRVITVFVDAESGAMRQMG